MKKAPWSGLGEEIDCEQEGLNMLCSMKEKVALFLLLIGVACSSLAQDALVEEITAVNVGKAHIEEVEGLARRIFKESELVLKDKAVAQRWMLLLDEAQVVEALRCLCETSARKVKISRALDAVELQESYHGIKVQTAVAELVTRTLRQNPQEIDQAKVEGKLQMVLPILKSLVQQGVELRGLLGAGSRPVLFDTSPPPSAAEVAANNARSLLPHIQKAQETLMDAVWPVYVMRLRLSREEAIARLVRSGLTRECLDGLLKTTYHE
ncbi:hypothetical protein [Prosthecobacter fluviatilis]|uniref:Uncharacterized protein n=1 Tax=Prosthecobacter fluviatilis TaxID=445931 RepID=A0ABW0KV93_9BACT